MVVRYYYYYHLLTTCIENAEPDLLLLSRLMYELPEHYFQDIPVEDFLQTTSQMNVPMV